MDRKLRWMIVLFSIGIVNFACSGSGGGSTEDALVVTGQELVDRAIADWLDVDFSYNSPDGTSDTDSDGQIDTNDAVNFIEALKALGYQIPETTIDGLYDNYYTPYGYTYADPSYNIDFSYSLSSPVSQADLKAHDWSGLEIGDMIFVDYDMDFSWDNCALYIGAYNSYTNAVLIASDYHDKVLVSDLDSGSEIIVLDISYGFCDVKKPNFDHFADYYTP